MNLQQYLCSIYYYNVDIQVAIDFLSGRSRLGQPRGVMENDRTLRCLPFYLISHQSH